MDRIAREIVRGLRADPPHLPTRLHYDPVGARLFEAICELEEYYIPRVEARILEDCLDEIREIVGPRAVVIEPGAGAAAKSELLLAGLDEPAQWVPIDIAETQLAASASRMAAKFPDLDVAPVAGDYLETFRMPPPPGDAAARLGFLPASTIGNFEWDGTVSFLQKLGAVAELVLVGIDLEKDPAILLPAYDDPQGVTAAFSRNLLARVNAVTGARFDVRGWRHEARWNAGEHRVEAHLVAERLQRVTIEGEAFEYRPGDSIRVEISRKFTLDDFATLARGAGLAVRHRWTDQDRWFAVVLLARAD